MDLLFKSLFYFFCVVIVSVYSETSTLTIPKHTATVPRVCPSGYISVDYKYFGFGSKEFRTTINGVTNGSDILEGSKKTAILSINDFISISRSNVSDSFILLYIRLFSPNSTGALFNFTDIYNVSQAEGLFMPNGEIVYSADVVGRKELVLLTIALNSTNKEILAGGLLMEACIKKGVPKDCDRPMSINYDTYRKTTRISLLDLQTFHSTDARNSLIKSPEGRWNVTVKPGQQYQYFIEFDTYCLTNGAVHGLTFTVEGISEFDIVIGNNIVKTVKDITESPYTYESQDFILGSSVLVNFVPKDDVVYIYDAEVGICCWREQSTTLPPTTMETPIMTTELLNATTISYGITPVSTTGRPCQCEMTTPLDYYNHTSNVSITDNTGVYLPGPRNVLLLSPEGPWSTYANVGSKYNILLKIVEVCSAWKIAKIHLTVKGVRNVQVFAGMTELESWDGIMSTSETNLTFTPCVLSNELLFIVEANGGNLQISNLFLELCACRAPIVGPTRTTSVLTSELTTSTLCDNDLLMERSTYDKKSFSLNMVTDDEGTITPIHDSYQVLRNSDHINWMMEARDDQLFTLNFTLLEKCSGKWEIATVNFRTQFAKGVQLVDEGVVKQNWTFVKYNVPRKVSTDIRKSIDGDVFQLVIQAAGQGNLFIDSLYMELFCNCTHETELPTTKGYMTTESKKCLPTHFINNDTVSKLNVSLVLLNEDREIVGDASPALGHDRWKVPVRSLDEMSLELKILELCINPRISSLKFTVEGVLSLSLTIDNETIIDKRTIPVGKKTIFEVEGPFKGSQIVLTFHEHKVQYFVYGLEVAVCCEYCPNALVIDYNQSSTKFEIEITDDTGHRPTRIDARPALLYGTVLANDRLISQTLSLVIKIREHCPTTWHIKQFQFGLDWVLKYEVQIGSKLIMSSEDITTADKFFTEKEGYFPGTKFELIVTQHSPLLNPAAIYDVRIVACCDDLSTGTTREITTETVHHSTETFTGLHTTEKITATTPLMT